MMSNKKQTQASIPMGDTKDNLETDLNKSLLFATQKEEEN